MVKASLRKSASPGRKFTQVRDGAWRVFARDGFAGASVDDIASSAGVSKATLYAYFPDKRLMFEEVVRAEMERVRDLPLDNVPAELPASRAIPMLSLAITAWLAADRRSQLMRLVIGEAVRFPSIATTFHERFTEALTSELAARLDQFVARDELAITDSQVAAEQLVHLCCIEALDKALLRIGRPDTETITLVARRAAEMFMRAYGNCECDGAKHGTHGHGRPGSSAVA